MLSKQIIQPVAPCLNCQNRCVGCHNNNCEKWAKYEQEKAEYKKQLDAERVCEDISKTNIRKHTKVHTSGGTWTDIYSNN